MAVIPGVIPVTGFIGPTDSTDVYAVTDSIYGIDGLRNVADHAERDAITAERRRQGMFVGTQNDNKYWSLNAGPWNFDATDWALALDLSAGPLTEIWETIGSDIQTSTSLFSPAVPNVLPAFDDQQDLGSVSARWRNLYVSGTLNFSTLGSPGPFNLELNTTLSGNHTQTLQDASGVIALLSDIPGATYGTTYFVTPFGDDSTGTVGDIGKPFLTISAARDQAVADAFPSSLIYIFPGTYTEDEIQYENGNFYFSAGAVVAPPARIHGNGINNLATGARLVVGGINQLNKTFTIDQLWAAELLPGNRFNIFPTSDVNAGTYTIVSATNLVSTTLVEVLEAIPSTTVITGANRPRLSTQKDIFAIGVVPLDTPHSSLKCSVFGQGRFEIPQTLDINWSGGFCQVGTTGDFYAEVDRVDIVRGVASSVVDSGILTMKGNFLNCSVSGYIANVRDSANAAYQFQRISNDGGGWPFIIREGNTLNFDGSCVISADEIAHTTAGPCILTDKITGNGFLSVTCPRIIAFNNYCINNSGQTGGEVIINGNLLTNGTSPGIVNRTSTGGRFTLNGNIILDTSIAFTNLNVNTNSNQLFTINGDIVIKTGVANAISFTTGKLRLNGAIYNPAGNGININGVGTLIVDTLKIIASGESITSTVPRNIKVIHSLASNVAMNANITNVIVATPVTIDANVE